MNDFCEIWAIVLAAGESKRMQAPKLGLPYNGSTVLGSVLKAILGSGINNLLVVTGGWKEEVTKIAGEFKVKSCHNKNFHDGMLSSVWCGLKNLPDGCRYAMICLGDQPLISSNTIQRLAHAALKGGAGIFVPLNMGRRGHPVIIDNSLFPEVFRLDEKVGLKSLMQKYPGKVNEVLISEDNVHVDIDTIQDYNNILNKTI